MIVNLYVDHLASTPPASAEEVWNDTRENSKVYTEAAQRIGLTPSEYHEFRGKLLDGKAVFVKLPRRLDAMAGNRRGNVYAVHNAVMTSSVMGWRVALGDGNVVYVPQICGNLSLLRPAAIAHVAPTPAHVATRRSRAPFTPAIATLPPAETPVAMVPPAAAVPAAPVAPAAAPAAVAAAAPAAGGLSPFLFIVPAAIGGAIAGFTHHGPSTAPACTAGSNTSGVCSK